MDLQEGSNFLFLHARWVRFAGLFPAVAHHEDLAGVSVTQHPCHRDLHLDEHRLVLRHPSELLVRVRTENGRPVLSKQIGVYEVKGAGLDVLACIRLHTRQRWRCHKCPDDVTALPFRELAVCSWRADVDLLQDSLPVFGVKDLESYHCLHA